MICPSCNGTGKIEKPIDMRTMGEFPCENCGGTGTLPEDDDAILTRLGEVEEKILNAVRYIQVQNRSLFYRPDLHSVLVNDIKEPFKAAVGRISGRKRRYGFWGKAKALWMMWKVFRAVRRLPRPTRGNVGRPNSRLFCDIRDEFFTHFGGFPFIKELKTAVDLFIIVYDTDFYRPYINVWVDALRNAESWIPNGPHDLDGNYWK